MGLQLLYHGSFNLVMEYNSSQDLVRINVKFNKKHKSQTTKRGE